MLGGNNGIMCLKKRINCLPDVLNHTGSSCSGLSRFQRIAGGGNPLKGFKAVIIPLESIKSQQKQLREADPQAIQHATQLHDCGLWKM